MKYKRLLIFVTSMIFFTAFVICFFAFFQTAEIYVDVKTVDGSNEKVDEKVEACLKDIEGKNLLFISTDQVKEKINSVSSYAKVVNVVKNYPNKLEVFVEERIEQFSIKHNDKYYAVDGKLHVLSEKVDNVNNVDGKPNILLTFDIADVDTSSIKIGNNVKIYDEKTFNYLKLCEQFLFDKRGDISSINVTVKKDKFYFRRLTLTMREGMIINIDKADVLTVEKLTKALEFYYSSQNKGDDKEYFVNVLESTGEIVVTL